MNPLVGPAATAVAPEARRAGAGAPTGVTRVCALGDLAPGDDVRTTTAVAAARVDVRGNEVAVFATDPSARGGALGAADCALIAELVDGAVADGVPVVALWHSAGARIDEGVASLDGMGRVFAAITRASGRVPLLSLVLGSSAGGAAYGAALGDVVLTAPAGNLFVTGPGVVAEVTGSEVSMADLGAPDVHARRSGVVHLACEDEASALARLRDLVQLLAGPAPDATALLQGDQRFEAVLPERSRCAYDVRPLVALLLDEHAPVVELHALWAPNVVTTIGRLGGRTVGVLANNPLRLAGCLDARAADKAARFVRTCDALGIPLVVVVDVPGYLPGVGQEWEGVLRRGAKLLHAFADASVPRVTLHTRKAYGGAYIAMNSRSLGASAVLAWPTAEIAVMGAEAGARVRHRRELEAAPDDERAALLRRLVEDEPAGEGLAQAVAGGMVDRVIDPARTRIEVDRALRQAPPGRGRHRNIPL